MSEFSLSDGQPHSPGTIPSSSRRAHEHPGEQSNNEQLRRSHDTFYNLIQNNPFGVYVIDADFRLLQVSRGAQKVFSNIHPLLGRDFAEILRLIWTEPFASEAIAKFRHTLDTGESYVAKRTVERRQNVPEVEAYDWRIERITLPDGRFGVVCYFYDLSERQALEAAVRQSEERFRVLFEQAAVGMAEVDLSGHFIRVNAAYGRITGYAPQELAAQHVTLLTFPDDATEDAAIRAQILQERGLASRREKRFFRKDGALIWVDLAITLVRDETDQPLHFIASITDVTERRIAEVEAATLATLVKSSRDAIFMVDLDGNIQTWNPGGVHVFGYTPDEMIGKNILVIVPVDRRHETRQLLERVRRGERVAERETIRIRKDGSLIDVSITLDPVFDAAGKLLSAAATVRDITLRKRAEEARRMSEFRFQRLIEQSPLSTQIFRADGTVTQVNKAWEKLWGFALAQLPHYNILEDKQLDALGVKHLIRKAFSGEPADIPPIPYEPPVGQFAGQVRWVGAYIYPVRDDAGRVDEVVLVHNDVTEKKLAEEALERTTERLELAQRAGHIGVFDWDLVSGKIHWSEEQERIFGFAVGAFDGTLQSWEKLVDSQDLNHIQRDLSDALASRLHSISFSFRMRRTDGQLRWIEGSGRVIYSDQGKPLRMVGVNIDVTERRIAEERVTRLYAISAALSLARTTADVARVAVEQGVAAVGATAGSLALLSEDAKSLEMLASVGYPAGVLDRWQRFPLDAPIPLADAVRLGAPVYLTDPQERLARYSALSVVRASAETHASACIPLHVGGSAVGVLGLSFDHAGAIAEDDRAFIESLTRQCAQALERVRLFEAERRARVDAEHASEAKSEFLATLSHELRTPLTPVLLTVSLMENHPHLPADLRDDVATIRRNVELESRLIGDLLDLTRITRGKLQLDEQDVDLHLVIRSAIDICQREASARVIVDLGAQNHFVRGDSTRLQQIFWNLINNAQKFTPPQGSISIRSRSVDGRIRVDIIDTGAGISPDVLPRLFNAFEQGDLRTTRQQAGLGLGLAISKRLTEAHHGSISASSAGPGHGATFTVDLPTIESRAPGASAPEAPSAAHGTRPLHILVVEDHEPTLRVLEKLLRHSGHRVTGVMSASSAIAAAAHTNFDLLISDLGLPDGSGLDIMRHLRPQYQGKAIALTGYGMDSDTTATKEAGFSEHLIKPVDMNALESAISRLSSPAR